MLLSATGTFSADSGRSIFLEQHLEQSGSRKYFRWEIPYPYIYRIAAAEALMQAAGDAGETPGNFASQQGDARAPQGATVEKAAAAAAGESSGGAPSILPFPHRPKTA
jgi:hypothetical protein